MGGSILTTARRFDNQTTTAMSLKITEECTFCGACEPECPVNAISAGTDIYVIDESACTECEGYADQPACASVCPAECIVKA